MEALRQANRLERRSAPEPAARRLREPEARASADAQPAPGAPLPTPALDDEHEYRRNDRLGSILNGVVERYERRRSAMDRARPPGQPDAPARRKAALAAAAREAAARAPMTLDGRVAVTLRIADPSAVDAVADFVDANGGSARNRGEDYVEAYLPAPLLAPASRLPGVVRVRAIVPPRSHRGRVVSQGVQVHKAAAWHSAGYTGAGVKVGVIDLGFKGFGALTGTELPDAVAVRCYASAGSHTDDLAACGESNHGTAVAESLLDIAPDAELHIANFQSPGDFRAVVDWMAAQGVRVINASLGSLWDGPGDGTSPFGESYLNAVDAAVANGVLFTISAGNAALETWYGDFKDADGDGWHEFGATSNRCNRVQLFGSALIQLRWAGSWPGAATDLDIVAFTADGSRLVARSGEPQSGGDGHYPHELLVLEQGATTEYCVAVQRRSGAAPDWIQFQVFSGGAPDISTSHGAIGNPAETASPGALAVGAAPHNNTERIESFSARGPAPDGRLKPDLVGADAAPSVSIPTFFGTSQSAPHVAGMAALLLEGDPSLEPRGLADLLKSEAADRGPGGPDNTWGHGFAELPDPATDANLAGIELALPNGTPVAVAPAFGPQTSRYAAAVATSTTRVVVAAYLGPDNTGVTITPADADTGVEGHQVDLLHGRNDIVLAATGSAGGRKSYRVAVTRGTADVDLAELRLSRGALAPRFSPGTHAYTSRVGDRLSATRATVTARASDAGAAVAIAPADIDAGVPGHQVALAAGANAVEVRVTAAGGSPSKTYRVDVTRAATPANHAPTADAGPPQTVEEDATATLAGGGTDPEGATLGCRWRQTGGVAVALSDPYACRPTFTAPNLLSDGTLTFELVVNDGAQDSETAAEVAIAVRADNDAPTAHAGPDVLMAASTTVTLVGDKSWDPEGQDLAYAWSQRSGPTVAIANATSTRATFTTPAVDANTTLVFALVVNDGTSDSAPDTVEIDVATEVVDYDGDEDGLIEIATVAQLDAVRHDMSGTGRRVLAKLPAYAAAFPDPADGMGCPAAACVGYELAADLDLDVAPHNAGAGWAPLGTNAVSSAAQLDFRATFQGNGHAIANLFIDRPAGPTGTGVGLFAYNSGRIDGVVLSNPNVAGYRQVGGLAGYNVGDVSGSRVVAGVVSGVHSVGGLVGRNASGGAIVASRSSAAVRGASAYAGGLAGVNNGRVAASYATGAVAGNTDVGGAVGGNFPLGVVSASYATGAVDGNYRVGGLVGDSFYKETNRALVVASYATGAVTGNARPGGLTGVDDAETRDSYYDTGATGQRQPPRPPGSEVGGLGKTASELRTPTGYEGIYADWDVDADGDGDADDPWRFGSASQYPALRHGGLDAAAQFAAQGAAPPAGAALGALAVSAGALHPAFDAGATVYAVNVGRAVEQITVTAAAADPMASVVVLPADADGVAPGHQVDLREAVNTVSVGVSPADGSATRTYVLNVARGFWDADHDGYIEVSTVAQLAAIRYDVDADGVPARERIGVATSRPFPAYGEAFDSPPEGTYCARVCVGYELAADLDLDVAPHNAGEGWLPLGWALENRTAGSSPDPFTAAFKGNGHVVSNLFVDRPEDTRVGFVAHAAGRIEDLRLRDVNVAGGSVVGALAGLGDLGSSVVGSWATGVVRGTADTVGGLVGASSGLVAGSFASVAARGSERVGGLVGELLGSLGGGAVVASYARGVVTAVRDAGGLVGTALGNPVVRASYSAATVAGRATTGGLVGGDRPAQATASYWDLATSGRAISQGGTGLATSQLQTPTGYADAFADWNVDLDGDGVADDPWDFGTSGQYPVLKRRGLDADAQFALQELSPATELSALGISPGALRPAFDNAVLAYAAVVDADVSRATVTATPADGAATVAIFPADADRAAAGHQVRLRRGVTAVTVAVTAPDGSGRTFLLSVARGANDTDFDNRIEVSTPAQLAAMRWDVHGVGASDFPARAAAYAEAFGAPAVGAVCPLGCSGYELVADLDLSGVDWTPIGLEPDPSYAYYSVGPFETVFDGNGHTIRNLTIDGSSHPRAGLFAELGPGAEVRNLGLADAAVALRTPGHAAPLAGWSHGTVAGSWATGAVSVAEVGGFGGVAGGLVGQNSGVVAGSWSAAGVSAGFAGGLVGLNAPFPGASYPSGIVRASYASGPVSSRGAAGGLVGFGAFGAIEASYAAGAVAALDSGVATGGLVGLDPGGFDPDTFMSTATSTTVVASYWDVQATGVAVATSTVAAGVGRTTAQLQGPTGYAGIYADWNADLDGDGEADAPWDFGTSSQYPVLRHGGLADLASLRGLDFRSDAAREPRSSSLAPPFSRSRAETAYAAAYTAKPNGGATRLTVLAAAGNMASVDISPADADPVLPGHQVDVDRAGDVSIATTTVDGRAGGSYSVSLSERPNRPPAGRLEDVVLARGGILEIDLAARILDADGDDLAWAVDSFSPGLLSASLDGALLRLTGLEEGVAALRVRVADTRGGSLSRAFAVAVANASPEALGIADQALEVGRALDVPLAGAFRDPEGDPLAYAAESSNPSAVRASVAGETLRLTAADEGSSEVSVSASDGNTAAELSFLATAYNVVGFDPASASAPEGGVARLTVRMTRPREAAVALRWTAAADGDPATADADAGDYAEGSGEATIPAGETVAEIAVAIVDDDAVEPPRESFAVLLSVSGGDDPLGARTATVAIEEGVCDRSPPVRDALAALTEPPGGGAGGAWTCRSPTAAALAAVGTLDLGGRGVESLRAEDLLGLSGLRSLVLRGNRLAELPEGLLRRAPRVRLVDLGGNRLAELPAGAFAGLAGLRRLELDGNALRALPPGAFAGLEELRHLDLGGSALTAAAAREFAGLAGLETLRLAGSRMWRTLPPGAFRGLAGLRGLDLGGSGVSELSAGAFEGLGALETLRLGGNGLETLPEGAWRGIGGLRWLGLADNSLAELPAGSFRGLPRLGGLELGGNGLSEVSAEAFEGLARLAALGLGGNALETLPAGTFGGLPALRRLDLSGNALATLPDGLFAGAAALGELDLGGNPGAPFALAMELARTDAAAPGPGPATLVARVAAGAPFPMRARLAVSGAEVSDAAGALEGVSVGRGGVASAPFRAALAEGAGAAAVVALEVDAAPDDLCGERPFRRCFAGVETAAGPPLALFKTPPAVVGAAPRGVSLSGVDEYRAPLAALFAAAPGETLEFTARSDDPALARARVEDGVLAVSANLDGREGVATVVVVATGRDGLRATLRFRVAVEYLPAFGRPRGWRLTLLDAAPAEPGAAREPTRREE